MPRISLIPTRTPDGRHIIFRAEVVSHRERLRRMVRRALGRRPAVQPG